MSKARYIFDMDLATITLSMEVRFDYVKFTFVSS